MKTEIYVVYCNYPFWKRNADLPRRKWVKFKSKEDAREFVETKINNHRRRFLWAYVINGMEVESI